MKKTSAYIVAAILLSSYSAIAFDGGRGMQVALTEHDESKIVPTAPIGGQVALSVTGCEKLLGFPKDGTGQLSIVKTDETKGQKLIAVLGTGL